MPPVNDTNGTAVAQGATGNPGADEYVDVTYPGPPPHTIRYEKSALTPAQWALLVKAFGDTTFKVDTTTDAGVVTDVQLHR